MIGVERNTNNSAEEENAKKKIKDFRRTVMKKV